MASSQYMYIHSANVELNVVLVWLQKGIFSFCFFSRKIYLLPPASIISKFSVLFALILKQNSPTISVAKAITTTNKGTRMAGIMVERFEVDGVMTS